MELILYTRNYNVADTIYNFTELYYSLQLKHLASDLLDKGLSPEQISSAVVKAIRVVNSSGMATREHFMPVYSSINHKIVKDCKLSHLGYGLVMMNADPTLSIVGEFQVSILKELLEIESLFV